MVAEEIEPTGWKGWQVKGVSMKKRLIVYVRYVPTGSIADETRRGLGEQVGVLERLEPPKKINNNNILMHVIGCACLLESSEV